jgi:hypothetical protein
MNRGCNAARAALGVLLAGIVMPAVAAGTSTGIEHRDAWLNAQSKYKAAIEQCATLPSDAKQACESKAKAAKANAQADENAAYRESDARKDQRVDSAKADHAVDVERCDTMSGNAKQACLDQARAGLDERAAAARQDAGQEKLDADYRMAMEQCNAMSGRQKETCAAGAKARFGK